jgi:hypothetical protein
MRFMTLVKSIEGGGRPPQPLIDAITKLAEDATRAGVFLDTGGLHPTASATRVRISKDGDLTITDGPFAEAKEVVGGYAVFEVGSKEEVLEWTRRFMLLHKEHWPGWEGETEVRQMFEQVPGDPRAVRTAA